VRDPDEGTELEGRERRKETGDLPDPLKDRFRVRHKNNQEKGERR
jgi:hypothetical protein